LKAPVLNNTPIYTPLPTPIPISEQVWPAGTEPLVHIRTMVYNHEKYLRTCLDSILMQKTTFPVRMIIHDDASTDASPVILKEYAERYPNLIWVYTQSANTFNIKNRRERLSKRKIFHTWRNSPYEALCEGDDFWTDPMKLQIQADFLEKNPNYAGVSHATTILNENGRTASANDFWQLLKEDTDLGLAQIVQKKVPFHTSSFFFRSHVIPKIINFPFRAKSADWVTFSIVAMEGNIRYMHRKMSVYRTHIYGITSIENHFDAISITLNRYKMWQHLKRYSIKKEHTFIFEKMIHYQHKYLIYEYPTTNFNTLIKIFSIIIKEGEWKMAFKFMQHKLRSIYNK